ncbi:hypothetical protein LPJ61_001995 [Coemansia biformis]|uniref:Uncharacterized protein n=1 Tax=Coemansia biformis TaxID=1286918 RepID=A0A9W7YFU6_9FUNG|nr:hypothetical protein LPJ61_001995 [Coemansia biformis]
MEAVSRNSTLVYRYTLDNEYPPPMIEYAPVRWIPFVFAALFPVLVARVLAAARATRAPWLCAAALAPILLFIALVLRGAMGRGDGDAFRMYETQTVLHLCAGHTLVGMLLAFAAKWIEIERQAIVGVFLAHLGIAYTVVAVVCTCVGFPLAFDAVEERRICGYRLVSAPLIVAIGMVLLGATLALYHTDGRRGGGADAGTAGRLAIVWIPAALLACWASFELARMSMPTKSAANTSEALFYCLSVLPLAGTLTVWTGRAEGLLAGVGDGGSTVTAAAGAGRGAAPCGCGRTLIAGPCQGCAHEASLWRAMQKYA